MNRKSLGVLLVLNLVLIASLAVVSLTPAPAQAQLGGRGGNYVMIAGPLRGRAQQSGVYVLDLARGQMAWVIYNSDTGKPELVARRDVGADVRNQRVDR